MPKSGTQSNAKTQDSGEDVIFMFNGKCFECAKRIKVRRKGRLINGVAHVLCDDCRTNAQQDNLEYDGGLAQ